MAFGVALLLVPFQAAAEEFSYRGVVLQTLGRATRARALLYVIPGILFAAMHSSQGVGAWIYAEVFAASCFLTWLVMREGNLAAAIGAHAGNNISAVVFGNADSPIYPHALFLDSGPTTMIDVLCSIGTMVAFVVIWSLVDRPAADRHGFVAVST
ncbi:hypothetical protein TMPK1_34250 [Rhodospirillales bacterium TMPK1]|uniref:CAAX prenyl protease 2/Lysostaphin resistance protein A-like domain-containing protein n=2 Tax=Roseiterribacter gracilis TaxID=2812848 RepID=A0A8S8XB34_9PROT|nr:hypothetical protein TMPK1_34250 [Rhodospirillales bacterium TMPK1]